MDAPSLPEGAQVWTVQPLLLSGKLYQYLADLNDQAQARLEVIIRQMQSNEGVDEKVKAMDQMLWVGRMNNIRQRAKEMRWMN